MKTKFIVIENCGYMDLHITNNDFNNNQTIKNIYADNNIAIKIIIECAKALSHYYCHVTDQIIDYIKCVEIIKDNDFPNHDYIKIIFEMEEELLGNETIHVLTFDTEEMEVIRILK